MVFFLIDQTDMNKLKS